MNKLQEKRKDLAALEAEKEWHASEIYRLQQEIAEIRDFLQETDHTEGCTCMVCEEK